MTFKKRFSITTIFTCLFVLMFFAAPVVADDLGFSEEGIFVDALYSEFSPYLSKTESMPSSRVIRSRVVKVNFDEIFKDFGRNNSAKKDAWANKLLHINLFHDVVFTVRLDNVKSNRSGSTTWIGKGIQNGHSSSIFTIKDKIMIGSFSRGNKNFVIRYIGGEFHEIQETDHSKFGGCEEPQTSGDLAEAMSHEGLDHATADDGSVIDVMVVYNASARSAAGSTAAMESVIDQAVAESNTGYSNSNVTTSLNLVHTAEVTYSESGFNWSTCLNRLVGTSDGYMDNVHSLRDTYKADVVVLVVENQSYCGLANAIMASESGAFCLVSRVCATGYYSFAHEIGHLQGARHDRYVDGTDGSPYNYNHGRTYPTGQWRTIMAYNNACAAAGTSCTRINWWSNPSVTYGGVATGISGGAGVGADNHLCLNNTKVTVANFRDSAGGGGTPTYCASASTNQSYEWIAGVQVGSLNNASGASPYSDFTSIVTNMTKGANASVTLTPGFGSGSYTEYWEVYIDYNQDADFDDPGEKVFTGYGSSNVTGNFTVSSSATTGNTRMRVNMQYNSYRNNPCDSFTYGEVEDYTVNIL